MKIKDYIDYKKYEICDLPSGLKLSTISCTCKPGLLTKVHLDKIMKYIPLNSDNILKAKSTNYTTRSLLPEIPKKKRKKTVVKPKEKKRDFYHQVSLCIRVFEGKYENLNKEEKIDIKVFNNGSLQLSGVNKIEYANRVINKLINVLKKPMALLVEDKLEKFYFVEEPEKLGIGKFQINMANAAFKVSHEIDLNQLYNLLIKKKVKCTYETCIRPPVIIKYQPKDSEDEVTIDVYQKCKINITGAKSRSAIIESFNYVKNILFNHADTVIKKDIEKEEKDILKYFEDIKKEYSHKLHELNISNLGIQ